MTEPHVPKRYFQDQELGDAILSGSAKRISEALEGAHLEETIENLTRCVGRLVAYTVEQNKSRAEEIADFLADACGNW